MLEQGTGDQVEGVAPLGQQHAAAVLLVGQDALHLLVDDPGRLVAVVAGGHEVLAEEHLVVAAPGHGAHTVAHAPLTHHLAGQLGCTHQVVAGAGRDHAEHQFLGDAAAHPQHQRVLEVVLPVDVALLLRKLHRDAQSHAAGDDRDLVQGVGGGQHGGAEGVPGLVVGDRLLLGDGQRQRLALLAHERAVAGRLEVVGVDGIGTLAYRH